jgi:hypothetical protein
VAFVTTRPNRNVYLVRYLIDLSTKRGYVYIPGKGEKGYADNTWMILRGIEGNWFHAWDAWEAIAHPLIDAR